MKGKLLKKVIASVSAVSMLAPMAFALPASAETIREDVYKLETFDDYAASANTEVTNDPSDETNNVLKISQGANVIFTNAFNFPSTGFMTFDINYATKVTGKATKDYNGLYFAFAEASGKLGTVMKIYGESTDTNVPVGYTYGGGSGQYAKAGDATIGKWYTVLVTVDKGAGSVSYKYYDKSEYADKGAEATPVISSPSMGYRNSQVPMSLIIDMNTAADEYIYIDNIYSYTETDPDAKNELKDVAFKTTPGATITPPAGDKEQKSFPVELSLIGTKDGEEFTEDMCDSIVWSYKGSEADDGYIGWNFTNGKASGNIVITNGVSTYYCVLNATVTSGETVISKDYKFVINPAGAVDGQIYPIGFPTDWNIYPDSLIGYTVSNGDISATDPLLARWASVGSNDSRTLTLKKDDATGNKYLEIDSHGGGGSTTSGVSIGAQNSQMIFEFEALPVSGSNFVYANNTPNNAAKRYGSAFEVSFDGSKVNTGTTKSNANNTGSEYTPGTQSIENVTADGKTWYKVIVSYDKSIQQYYINVYSADGSFIGTTGMQSASADASPSIFSMNGSATGIRNLRVYTPVVSSMKILSGSDSVRVPEEAGQSATLDLSAEMLTTDGLAVTGEVAWSFEDGEVANAEITPTGPQTATLTVSNGAASGDVTVVATKDGAQATKAIKFVTSANNVAFTKSTSSITIPFSGEPDVVSEFVAETRTGDGNPVGGSDAITYKLLDSTGTKEASVKGVSFKDGVLTVSAGASPAIVYVQAENAEGLTNRVKVNIHGMTFAFGSENPEEGYTAVMASTVYSDNLGYGFASTAGLTNVDAVEETPSNVTGTEAYKMQVKVPNGNYTVTVSTTSASMLSEAVSGSATGISKSGNSFNVAVCDGILDLTFNANSSISTLQISQLAAPSPGSKPAIYSIGDSTTKNNGHYSKYKDDKAAQAQDPSKWVDEREYASWGNCVTADMYKDTFSSYNNHGMAGRNSANYYNQARLEAVLLAVAPGDYVTINMGINSEANEPYEQLMEYYYVQGVIQRGGIPVILSHTPDGPYDGYGSYDEQTGFNVSRASNGRVQFLKSLAEEYNLNYIDVGTWGENYFNSLTTDDLGLANTANKVNQNYSAPSTVLELVKSWYPDHNHYTVELGSKIAEYVIGELTKIANGNIEPPTPDTHTITFTGDNATVTVGGKTVTSTTVKDGDSVQFTVTAAEGYEVKEVKAGENVLEAVEGVYTLTGVTADTTVTITTEKVVVPESWIKYEATYENGVLKNVEITPNATPGSVNNDETHKIFFWNEKMQPWTAE